jgi:hypothetical protein
MVNHLKTSKLLRRFITNRSGTAEVIGSVLFIIILMYAFSNIYLWHDDAVKAMNTQMANKLSSQIEVHWRVENGVETDTLIVKNTGDVDSVLSRLWMNHQPFSLSDRSVKAGQTITIDVSDVTSQPKTSGDIYTVLTTLGNMASP